MQGVKELNRDERFIEMVKGLNYPVIENQVRGFWFRAVNLAGLSPPEPHPLQGVLAPNFEHCKRIVPRRSRLVDADTPPAPMSWMQRLKRVFAIDIETCPECGGKLRVITCVEDPPLIAISATMPG